MAIDYNKLEVRIALDRLRGNYRILKERGGNVMPVVKADAYGHGLLECAAALEKEGADTFAVGTVEEGAKLRDSGTEARIVSLLGPVGKAECALAVERGIVPFLHSMDQVKGMAKAASRAGASADVALKFDTGMSRLGFEERHVPALAEELGKAKGLNLAMVASHLATADDPEQAGFVAEQAECMGRITNALAGAGFDFQVSLANSGGILAHEGTRLNIQRAGISLYGVNPFKGTDWEDAGYGLMPAMEVTAPVVSVRELAPGSTVSYGRTFTVDRPLRVAVVAAGYADGYSRRLSNTGEVLIGNARAKILGRVCMQLIVVDVSFVPECKVGDKAWLLGGPGVKGIGPDEVAGWWGTITYEVFCLLGMNKRVYSDI